MVDGRRKRYLDEPYLITLLDIQHCIAVLQELIRQEALPVDCRPRAGSIVRSLRHLHRHVRQHRTPPP
jgi:hypothetical protein